MALPAVRSSNTQPLRWDPFRDFDALFDQLGRWTDTLVWSPLADVSETDDAYVVELDLPGVSRDDVTVDLTGSRLAITGEVKENARTADSGTTKRKGFCPNCGAPIYNKPDKSPEFIGIFVGSLDDATAFKPAVVLYCARGYAWDHLDPDVRKLPEWHPASK